MKLLDSDLSLRVLNDLSVLDESRIRVRRHLEDRGVDVHALHRVETALDELLTNVIKYGYDDHEDHTILVTVRTGSDSVVVIVDDDGRPFDPTQAGAPTLSTSIAEAKVGGLGLVLLRRITSEMRYERIGARNNVFIRIGRRAPRAE